MIEMPAHYARSAAQRSHAKVHVRDPVIHKFHWGLPERRNAFHGA